MTLAEHLADVGRLFLDTAPVIYFVENNPTYFPRVQAAFNLVDAGRLTAVTSPVTLAECLVHPYRLGLTDAVQSFTDLIVNAENTIYAPIEEQTARKAAELRALYNLSLTDAFQIAVAPSAGCDAFLTNDAQLKRVTEIAIIVLDDLTPESAAADDSHQAFSDESPT